MALWPRRLCGRNLLFLGILPASSPIRSFTVRPAARSVSAFVAAAASNDDSNGPHYRRRSVTTIPSQRQTCSSSTRTSIPMKQGEESNEKPLRDDIEYNTATTRDNPNNRIPPQQVPMPLIGWGTYMVDRKDVATALRSAILDVGYRRIDCAPVYFNEDAIGDALFDILRHDTNGDTSTTTMPSNNDATLNSAALENDGHNKPHPNEKRLQRSDLYIVSKLPSPFHTNVEAAVRKTLNDLRLDYLDLYLVHWPVAFYPVPIDITQRGWTDEAIDDGNGGLNIDDSVSIHDTWRGMQHVWQLGLVRQIGVSNMPIMLLHELLSRATIPPMVNQVELHPYLQQSRLLSYCRRRHIHIQAYSPLGTPGYKELHEPSVLDNVVLIRLAQRYNVSTAHICLTWALQRGTSVVVKSSNAQHLRDNLSVLKNGSAATVNMTNHNDDNGNTSNSAAAVPPLQFRLTDDEMLEIAQLDRGHRFFRPHDWWGDKAMAVFD